MKGKVILITLSIIVAGFVITGAGAQLEKSQPAHSFPAVKLTFTLIGRDEYLSQNFTFTRNSSVSIFFNAPTIYLVSSENLTNYSIAHIKQVSIIPTTKEAGVFSYVNLNGSFELVAVSSTVPTASYSTQQSSVSFTFATFLVLLGIVIILIGLVAMFFVIFRPEPEY